MIIGIPQTVRTAFRLLMFAACFFSCRSADPSTASSCKLVAGVEFAGTVTDPTGRSQNTRMTLTRVSAATNGGMVTFNGSVAGSDVWVTDSAKTFLHNGQTRLLTTTGDTLALSCEGKKRSLTCESAARGRCLLAEVTQ